MSSATGLKFFSSSGGHPKGVLFMNHKKGRPALAYETIPRLEKWLGYYADYQAGTWNITDIADITGVNRKTVYKYFRLIAKHREEVFPKVKEAEAEI